MCAWARPLPRSAEAALIAAFGQAGLPMIVERPTGDPQAAIDRDEALLRAAMAGDGPDRLLRIWANDRCLVATRQQGRSPRFEAASAAAQARGWPVAVRASGGTTVVHRPGILNISLITTVPPATPIAATYGELLRLLASAVGALGLACTAGPCPGANCDGDHNLLLGGRKLAGTAMIVKRAGNRSWRLAHAALMASGSPDKDLSTIMAFEQVLGQEQAYNADSLVSVARSLGTETKKRAREPQVAALNMNRK